MEKIITLIIARSPRVFLYEYALKLLYGIYRASFLGIRKGWACGRIMTINWLPRYTPIYYHIITIDWDLHIYFYHWPYKVKYPRIDFPRIGFREIDPHLDMIYEMCAAQGDIASPMSQEYLECKWNILRDWNLWLEFLRLGNGL